jgi:hypothetical protein
MKLKSNLLALTSSLLLAMGGQAVAQTPKDQIALQLGAIQMGYTVPFAVSANSTATKKQQAVNSLVMGRNAMNATVARPAATVKGVVTSPNINTADYRDQLYSAVEYVVTSPVSASINGTVVMSNNATVTVNATVLRAASVSNDWMTPVPYALESRSSVDTQALRAELIAAGVLKSPPQPSDPTFVFCVNYEVYNNTAHVTDNKLAFYTGNHTKGPFQTFISNRLATNDRIAVYNYNLLNEATSIPNYLNRTKIPVSFSHGVGEPKVNANLIAYIAIPQSQGILKTFVNNGFTQTIGGTFSQSQNAMNSLMPIRYNNVLYNVYRLNNPTRATIWGIYLNP